MRSARGWRVRAICPSLLDEIVRAAIEITSADMGTVQLVDETGGLTIAAQSGFERPFLDFFQPRQTPAPSACGAALASRERVIVDDVTQDPMLRRLPVAEGAAGRGRAGRAIDAAGGSVWGAGRHVVHTLRTAAHFDER